MDLRKESTQTSTSARDISSDISLIPGLSISRSQSIQTDDISGRDENCAQSPSDMDDSPLGELRFKD